MGIIRFGLFGILLVSTTIGLCADGLVYHPMDEDIIMPSYPFDGLTNRIEGSVLYRLVFNQKKVESVSVVSSTLKMGRPPLRPDPVYQEPALVRGVQESLQRTISQWTTIFLDRCEYQVEIRLKVDDSLGLGQRRFYIEYGKDSIVSLIELTGPGIEWERLIKAPRAPSRPPNKP